MKKALCLILVLLTLIPALPALAEEEEHRIIVNCDDWVTMRRTPSVSGEVITQIPANSDVVLLEYDKDHFTKIRWREWEGYVLSGYVSEPATVFLTTGETAAYKTTETGAEVIGTIPAGLLLYSGYKPTEELYSVLWDGDYRYVRAEDLAAADMGMAVARWAEHELPVYRYATKSSEVIATVPEGGKFSCLSTMSADGAIYGEYDGVRGFVNAAGLCMISPDADIVSAEINGSINAVTIYQRVEDPEKLGELKRLICASEPGWVGKCPMAATVKLEMSDGTVCSFIYPVDGCSSMVGMDSSVYCIPDSINGGFWEVFDTAYEQISQW